MSDENDRVKPMDEQAEFVASFVDESRNVRDSFDSIWDEVELNYLVRSFNDSVPSTRYPLANDVTGSTPASVLQPGQAILKDPETHQSVMTIVSKIVLGTMGEPGFLKATRVGFEDIFRASITSKLLEYDFRLEGHFWECIQWVLGACVYGTGVLEAGWKYEEGPRTFRRLQRDEYTGRLRDDSDVMIVPVWDDPELRTIQIRDFFPDHGETMISRMKGAAKRFKITAADARQRADGDDALYDAKAVEEAVEARASEMSADTRDHPGDETTGTHDRMSHPDFMELVAYEYYGKVPFKTSDGISDRVITAINGVTVRTDPWPRRLPFFDCKITPRLGGSFYGLSPAEVMKDDQDFADTLKMMLADAVVRQVHGQPIVNKDQVPDYARMRRFRPDVPVPVEGDARTAVAWNQYRPDLSGAFAMQAGLKNQMREGSGALGAIQGLGLGTKRFSATEAAGTFEQAFDRPEMWGLIHELENLPPLGKYLLTINQEFLDTDEDLQLRVGETKAPVLLADIQADYDVQFVGSRREGSKQQKIAAFREIAAAGASNPLIMQMVPWVPLLRKWFEDMGAPEIAAMVGNPQLIQLHTQLMTLAPQSNQGGGNFNGEAPSNPPSALLPAQVSGQTG